MGTTTCVMLRLAGGCAPSVVRRQFPAHCRTKIIIPEVPTSDDEFVGKDLRKLTNRQFISYKAHRRTRTMARHHNIFHDVLPEVPTNINLKVEYGESRWDMVYRGNLMEQQQVASPPRVSFPTDGLKVSSETLWTLLMVDAGADSELGGQLVPHKLHWLMTNISGGAGELKGDTIVDYTAPVG